MFCVGDKIVHPMHGAGVIESIVEQRVEGTVREYYVLKMPVMGMMVMIPIHSTAEIGVRAIIDGDAAEALILSMGGLEIDATPNWNRRYRENMMRIKSGDLAEVARVVKSLMARENQRGLSTGERKMLHSAKQILISEIVLAQSADYDVVEKRITLALA